MKKLLRILSLTGLIFTSGLLSAPLQAQQTFYKTFDGLHNDVGYFVTATSDGGYMIAAKTNSLGAGGYDAWLLKTNASGDTLWTKTYGDTGDDDARCVRQTSDGGYIVAGNKTMSGRYNDGWIFKTDAQGVLEWEHTFGGDLNNDEGTFIIPAYESNYLVTGTLKGKSYVCEIDEKGTVLWEYTYFINNNSTANAACAIAKKSYAVSGDFQLSAAGSWYPNLFIVNDTGGIVTQLTWMQYAGGSARFVITATDSGFLMGGSWNGSPALMKMSATGLSGWEYFFPNPSATPYIYMLGAVGTPSDYVTCGNWNSGALLKINDSGDTLWSRKGRINDQEAYYTSIQKAADGGFVLTGYGKSEADNHQVFITKTTAEGSAVGIRIPFAPETKIPLIKTAPNPFVSTTTIRFTLYKEDHTVLYVSDALGRKVKTLLNKRLSSGDYQVDWNGINETGTSCPSGIYYLSIKTSGLLKTVKIIKTTAFHH
jgi:hypothetical protein